MTRKDYENYLRNIYLSPQGKPLAESSIRHYIQEAMRFIDEHMARITDAEYHSIFEIDTLDELQRVRNLFLQDGYFSETDTTGHRMYSAAFNRYLEFAEGTQFLNRERDLPLMDSPTLPMYRDHASERTVPERNRIKVIQIAWACRCRCELNPEHTTFIAAATNMPYFEGHHIIALKHQKEFRYSLDCYANLIVLCPTCHRLLHYGRKTETESILHSLYDSRMERYTNSGIDISLNEFIKLTS